MTATILNKDEFLQQRRANTLKLKSTVFIYPTDTIYGIGCDATDTKLVQRIRKLKKSRQPFSIIVPNKKWIVENCKMTKKAKTWLDKLPGPYTLIIPLTNKNCIASNVNMDKDTIGIRIPDNWFSEVASDLGVPIVTTSANVTGEDFMTSLENLKDEFKKGVDFVVYQGEIRGKPSTLVIIEDDDVTIKSRA